MAGACEGLEGGLREVELYGTAGEKQIARMLKRNRIEFLYEHPIAVVDRGKVRVWYPDFWLTDFGIAVEYAGMLNNKDYAAGVEHTQANSSSSKMN